MVIWPHSAKVENITVGGKISLEGVSAAMDPAGEIWSVVTESPSKHSTRASVIAPNPGASSVIPSKNGGFCTYVDFSSHGNRSLCEAGTAFHCSFSVYTAPYFSTNCSVVTHEATASCTSWFVGPFSLKLLQINRSYLLFFPIFKANYVSLQCKMAHIFLYRLTRRGEWKSFEPLACSLLKQLPEILLLNVLTLMCV